MTDELKEMLTTIFGLLFRWGLKFFGAFLTTNGISHDSAENVIVGLLVFAAGAVISLIMRKNDLAKEPQ